MATIETQAWRAGYADGYEMGQESGSADSGVDGWDGMALNAVGASAFFAACGVAYNPAVEAAGGWTPEQYTACQQYADGAQAGANAAVADAA